MFVFTAMTLGYVVLVVADLVLYYQLQRRVARLEERFGELEEDLFEEEDEAEAWTDTLNSHSQSL